MRIAGRFDFHSTRERSPLRGHLQPRRVRRFVRSVESAVVVVQVPVRTGPIIVIFLPQTC